MSKHTRRTLPPQRVTLQRVYVAPLQQRSFHRPKGTLERRKLRYHIGHRIAGSIAVLVIIIEVAHCAEHAWARDIIGALAVIGSWLRDISHEFMARFVEEVTEEGGP